jgi:periplasmic protein TonB
MEPTAASPGWARFLRFLFVASAALGLALLCFLVLPLLQAISATPFADLEVRTVDTAALPPPPPPPVEEEPEPEPQDEAKPPELAEEAPPLDLAQLELALNPGMGGDGFGIGDTTIRIQALGNGGQGGGEELFALADLDQKPRPVFQQQPLLNAAMRRKVPATVNILFVVDEAGRVANPIVQNSTDPIFDAPALAAIKQWKFEPGRRAGKPVSSRMKQPMSFQ